MLHLLPPSFISIECDAAQTLHVVCYLSQDFYHSNATIECLQNNNPNSITCALNERDKAALHTIIIPLEYSYDVLGDGPHAIDMKFTDDCAQVKMESIPFYIQSVPQMND